MARPERREFSLEELIEWGLAGVHGEGPQERWAAYGGVSTRRRLVAEALGLHDGSAKVLLKNLNQFFRREEVEDALAGAPIPHPARPTVFNALRRLAIFLPSSTPIFWHSKPPPHGYFLVASFAHFGRRNTSRPPFPRPACLMHYCLPR